MTAKYQQTRRLSIKKKIPPKKTTFDLELDFAPFQFSRQSKAVVKSHRSKILSLR